MLLIAFCIFCLPMIAVTSHNNNVGGSASYAAFAGHSGQGGRSCTCGCPNCICDPGEPFQVCGQMVVAPVTTPDDTPSKKGKPSSDLDYGTGAMILALALFVWLRLRS